MPVALYARVSTERQGRNQTIDSQLTALRAWAAASGYDVIEDHVFRDEGLSGSRLDRPGLDCLRDAVRDGAVSIVAVLSPDRLARKFAYQVLLLEEFRRAGCAVVFLHHPISEDPNDQLLLQIQGAIAEYERAVLAERFRRGKLQKARAGQVLAGRAPYGYRYVHRREEVLGHLVIDDAEADLVRMLYAWLTEERMTIRQILKRLNFGPWAPRSGRHHWSTSTVHHILSDPVYAGTAYANRYVNVPARKPRSARGRNEPTCRQFRPREEWIAIPVPAIVDQATWDRAQDQLARNSVLSFRNNAKYNYLLRCLLTCQTCGLAMFGVTYRANATHPQRRYYCCHGKDCIQSARATPCPQRMVKADDLEQAVWEHVVALLSDPVQLAAQFERFTARAEAGTTQEQTAERQIEIRLRRLSQADRRLVDAYQAGVLKLEELAERRRHLADQQRALAQELEQVQRLRQQRAHAQEVLTNLTAFCERIRGRLQAATFADRQTILQLVIERIIVGEDTLEIRHVIPLHSPPPGRENTAEPDDRLRSDGVKPTPLMPCPGEDLVERFPEAQGTIGDRQFGGDLQAPRLQVDQQFVPALGTLANPDLEAEQLLPAFRRGADHHQHAVGHRFQTGLEINPVGPDRDGAPGRQVTLVPARVVIRPTFLQPGDD
jgi:site-specific DNA recombinase